MSIEDGLLDFDISKPIDAVVKGVLRNHGDWGYIETAGRLIDADADFIEMVENREPKVQLHPVEGKIRINDNNLRELLTNALYNSFNYFARQDNSTNANFCNLAQAGVAGAQLYSTSVYWLPEEVRKNEKSMAQYHGRVINSAKDRQEFDYQTQWKGKESVAYKLEVPLDDQTTFTFPTAMAALSEMQIGSNLTEDEKWDQIVDNTAGLLSEWNGPEMAFIYLARNGITYDEMWKVFKRVDTEYPVIKTKTPKQAQYSKPGQTDIAEYLAKKVKRAEGDRLTAADVDNVLGVLKEMLIDIPGMGRSGFRSTDEELSALRLHYANLATDTDVVVPSGKVVVTFPTLAHDFLEGIHALNKGISKGDDAWQLNNRKRQEYIMRKTMEMAKYIDGQPTTFELFGMMERPTPTRW